MSMLSAKIDKEVSQEITENLNKIKELMRVYELEKFPDKAYLNEDKSILKNLNPNAKSRDELIINYNGADLTEPELNKIEQASVKVRKLSILAGFINAMQYDDYFIKNGNSALRILEIAHNEIISNINEKKKISVPQDEINDFIKNLVKIIKNNSNLEEADIIRKIRNAERYFVADYRAEQPIKIFKTNLNGKTVVQVDEPIPNFLTNEQKQEYLKIHSLDKPQWFINLPQWEQAWLLAKVPITLNDRNWQLFENQSSAMQHLPGIKNGRVNYLAVEENGKWIVKSKSLKTSTMVPYEMPKENIENESEHNAQQVISNLSSLAEDNFKIWDNINLADKDNKKMKPLIVLQSLLSDVAIAGNDKSLVKQQSSAIKSQKDKFENVEIIHGNDPVNIFRLMFSQKEKRWRHTNEIMNYAEKLVTALEGKQLNVEQQSRFNTIKTLMNLIVKLHKISLNQAKLKMIDRRNLEQYKVAYLSLLVEALGGISTNCKSGKDRTGLDEIYRHAVHLYYDQYKKMPQFTDKGKDRKNFVAIVTQLFNNMKTQESAAANTPGSFGLKDGAMVLDKDIAKNLGDSYQTSNKRADMNKPPLFKEDEKKQSKERNEKKSEKEMVQERYTKDVEKTALTLQQKSFKLAKQLNIYEIFGEADKDPQPTTKVSTEYFNKLSGYVVHDIVSQTNDENKGDYKKAADKMAYWVNVIHYLIHDATPRDLFSAYAIYGALNNASVSRLKLDQTLNTNDEKKYDYIKELLDRKENFKNYREFYKTNPLTIPYLGLPDMTFLRESNDIKEKPNINKIFQAYAYKSMTSNLAINMKAIKSHDMKEIAPSDLSIAIEQIQVDEGKLYDLSLQMMPRGTEPPKVTAGSNFEKAYTTKNIAVEKKQAEPTTLIIVENENEKSNFKPPITIKYQNIVLEKEESYRDEIKKLTEELTHYFSETVGDGDDFMPIGKLRLYSLITYGEVREFTGKDLERALEKIQTFNEKDNLERVIAKETRILLAERTLEKYNKSHPEDTIALKNVILLKDYAYDIIDNKSQHLTKDQNAIYESPERKAIALINILQQDPYYLKPEDKGEEIARREIFPSILNEIKNKPSDYIQFLQKLKSITFKDPITKEEVKLNDIIPADHKEFNDLRKDLESNEAILVLHHNIKKELQKIVMYGKQYEQIKKDDRSTIDQNRIDQAKEIFDKLSGQSYSDQLVYIDSILNDKSNPIHKHKNILHRKSTTLVRHLKQIKRFAEQERNEIKILNEQPPFPGFSDRATKQGGKNSPGPFGGRYKKYEIAENGDKKLTEMAMIKLDTTPKGSRTEKVIGEFVAGQLMNALMQGVENGSQRMAHVDLIQAHQKEPFTKDPNGTSTYLKSTFIEGYKGDFWRYAYGEDRKRKYEKRFKGKSNNDIAKMAVKKLSLYYKAQIKRLARAPQSDAGAKKDLAEINKKYQDLSVSNIKNELIKENGLSKLVKEIVDSKLDAMGDKKPAVYSQLAAFGMSKELSQKIYSEARDVPSDAIRNTKGFMKEFAEITVPRLLLSDFGVHCANFGYIEINGELHLAAIDYGAAFSDFKQDFSPYERPENLLKMYKNHLLDYTKDIYKSEDMAKQFIRVGQFDLSSLQNTLKDTVEKLKQFYGLEPLKQFCKRIGMAKVEIDQCKSEDQLGEKIMSYFSETLKARQQILLDVGYDLLIKKCYEHGKLNADKLQQYKTDYPELTQYLSDHPESIPEHPDAKISTTIKLTQQSYLVDNDKDAISGKVDQFIAPSKIKKGSLQESKQNTDIPSNLSTDKALVTETTIIQNSKSLFSNKQNVVKFSSVMTTSANNSIRSDVKYNKKEIRKLNKEGCMILAKAEVDRFWKNAKPEAVMKISGNWSKKLVRSITLYCAVLNSDPNKKRDYQCSNQTGYRYEPKTAQVQKFKNRLDTYLKQNVINDDKIKNEPVKETIQQNKNNVPENDTLKTDLFSVLKQIYVAVMKFTGFHQDDNDTPKKTMGDSSSSSTSFSNEKVSSTANLNKVLVNDSELDELGYFLQKTSNDLNEIDGKIQEIIKNKDSSKQAIEHIKRFLEIEKNQINNLDQDKSQKQDKSHVTFLNQNSSLFQLKKKEINEKIENAYEQVKEIENHHRMGK